MSEHYSFKQKYYMPSFDNIKKTTLINYDSLVYDMKSKKLDSEYYQSCIDNRKIEFVGSRTAIKNNPTPCMNVLKILKIHSETEFALSYEVVEYVNDYLKKQDISDIEFMLKEYKRHYRTQMTDTFRGYLEEWIKSMGNQHTLVPDISINFHKESLKSFIK